LGNQISDLQFENHNHQLSQLRSLSCLVLNEFKCFQIVSFLEDRIANTNFCFLLFVVKIPKAFFIKFMVFYEKNLDLFQIQSKQGPTELMIFKMQYHLNA